MDRRTQKAMIPVEASFAAWRRDPKYVEAYEALEDEFVRASAKMRGSEISASRRRAGDGCR
jgi:hypothetical protein